MTKLQRRGSASALTLHTLTNTIGARPGPRASHAAHADQHNGAQPAKREHGWRPLTLHTLTDVMVRDLQDTCMDGSPLTEDCDRYLDQSGEVAEDDVAMSTDRIIEELNRRAEHKSPSSR